jgi:aminoglycoside phosphotransferase family enzyme
MRAPVEAPSRIALADKVAFLSRASAYPHHPARVKARETHMSWVFLAGDAVYKLKKPVRFPYLDFSTVAQREAACRAELRLNRRLAPDVYRDVVPLTCAAEGLAIGGTGAPVDWLVVMRRLDERCMLDHRIAHDTVAPWQLDRLVEVLSGFYRRARPVHLAPSACVAQWRAALAYNRRVLRAPDLRLPAGLITRIDAAQRRFLDRCGDLLVERHARHRIVDGHGDLRPEHICLNDAVRIIDCIEFNARLRAVDPFDEIAFLTVECDRLGAGWVARYLLQRLRRRLPEPPAPELFLFYRCYRATLRARLAIAHLLEPEPRTPEKWPRQAKAYLALAAADAVRLERRLRTPSVR